MSVLIVDISDRDIPKICHSYHWNKFDSTFSFNKHLLADISSGMYKSMYTLPIRRDSDEFYKLIMLRYVVDLFTLSWKYCNTTIEHDFIEVSSKEFKELTDKYCAPR